MGHKELVHESVAELIKETSSSKELRDAIEMLIKINRNALPADAPEKFCKIRIGNALFHQTLWRFRAARSILVVSGWTEEPYTVEDGATIQLSTKDNLNEVLEILLFYRTVSPKEEEWDERTKVVETGRATAQKLRDDDLKRKGLEEARKMRQQFLQDKAYREQLARNMKVEQEAERLARAARVPKTDEQIKAAEFNPNRSDRPALSELPIDSTEPAQPPNDQVEHDEPNEENESEND